MEKRDEGGREEVAEDAKIEREEEEEDILDDWGTVVFYRYECQFRINVIFFSSYSCSAEDFSQ